MIQTTAQLIVKWKPAPYAYATAASIGTRKNKVPSRLIQTLARTDAILDNYAAHKHPKVLAWLGRHPRWIFPFANSALWRKAVETFFSALTRRRLKRGAFRSVVDLQAPVNRYIAEHNADPSPSPGP